MDDEELSALVRRHASRHAAGETLRAAVRTQIALQAAAQSGAAPGWRGWAWRSAAAGFAGGAALTLALVFGFGALLPRLAAPPAPPAALVAELVADHVRALKTGALTAVASSDRHTVKPWFQGRLDYAPPVPELAAEGFPLLGGRTEQVDGSAVAVLAYMRQRHVVNVFVWPAEGEQPAQRAQQRGFNLLHWRDGAMQVWVVSDLEAAELDAFGRAFRTRRGTAIP